ncbi:histidine phosphatase family protein [Neptunomonas japonica]|uniref:Alpha-ribazole phosphatase n=1 Tax=Neptunomonas japonica JAMM 1380 TaxID=1441457 RepID=A0A7R6PIK5_9GAMM|nr:histidine phosphatase family protein [Neptunomonas japonica]BBB29781.1 alpha-ribazole phosphatase [Neptunomonas japonica JAMM 1380]
MKQYCNSKQPLIIDALRHGETVKGQCYLGRTDAELTDHGWQQMHTTVQNINVDDYDAIITSPLARCQAFAEHWVGLQESGTELLSIDPLIQEYDFGLWDGMTAIDIMLHWAEELADFWRDPDQYPPPQGELITEFFERLQFFLNAKITSEHNKVLLITHGGVIKALTCLNEGKSASRMFSVEAKHGELHQLVWQRS